MELGERERVLLRAGRILLPVSLGLLIGFWSADRGMRFIPDALILTALIVLTAFGLLSVAFYRAKPRAHTWLRVSVAGAALAALSLILLFVVARPTALTSQDANTFQKTFELDRLSLQQHAAGMARVLKNLERQKLPPAAADTVLSPDQEKALLDSWIAFRDYAIALEETRRFHEHYYRFDISRVERDKHLKSFLLTFAAELALYENAALFAARMAQNKNARKFLNAPHASKHLPAGSLSLMRQQLLGARDQARVLAGESYLESLRVAFDADELAAELGLRTLWLRIERSLNAIDAMGILDRTTQTVRSDFQQIKRGITRLWYPIQKDVAEKLGDTRVRRIGHYLIDKPLREKVDKQFEPGDVLIARKNWYLSNIGLPGFWPHTILYLGTPKKFATYFDADAGVKTWVEQQSEGKKHRFSEWLAARFPLAWRNYERSEKGEPRRVIEAVSEGVVFSTLGYCAGDYLAALRPRLDKRAKAQAIVYAFSQAGKPYDFDFDFATEHAIVCSELVWRAYRSAKDKGGLDLPLTKIAGRMTLPANDIAALYAKQYGADDRAFDFVAFVDANEEEGSAFLSTEEAFRKTHRRPKWDIVQK